LLLAMPCLARPASCRRLPWVQVACGSLRCSMCWCAGHALQYILACKPFYPTQPSTVPCLPCLPAPHKTCVAGCPRPGLAAGSPQCSMCWCAGHAAVRCDVKSTAPVATICPASSPPPKKSCAAGCPGPRRPARPLQCGVCWCTVHAAVLSRSAVRAVAAAAVRLGS
jgi:hypothetical protein